MYNIYFSSNDNIGDEYSTPTKYFNFNDIKIIDLFDVPIGAINYNESAIFGGGGIFSGYNMVLELFNNFKNKIIVWGSGTNYSGTEKYQYPSLIKKIDLFGCRDWGISKENWTPCVSCMHEIFNNKYEIKNEIVFLKHQNEEINFSIPTMDNKKSNKTFEEIIEFLGTAETIISNSYHGIYWGLLLGKKVVCLKPRSTRFFGFKWDVPLTMADNINTLKHLAKNFDILEECREANIKFYDKVMNLLES